MTDKYPVELDKYECKLILENSILYGHLKSTLARMANKQGFHHIQMTLHDVTDIIGWLAGEANHTQDQKLAIELNELCDRLENIEFQIKTGVKSPKSINN